MENLRDVITRHGIAPRKSLGQHFLLDPTLLDRIVRAAAPLGGAHVIEIGPGPGGLTRALLASDAASVTAIEIDRRAVAAVTALQASHPDRLRIIEMDARQADLAVLVAAPRIIVANLPYNIGTALLVGWLQQAGLFQSMTLMFQQEVAERIVAAPGSAAYGRLAVLAGLTTQAEIVMHVPAAAFKPPPKVASAVVRLTPLSPQPAPALVRAVAKVTEAAFGQRRKMLRGSLKALGGETLLAAANIAPERRAETLTPVEFVRIARRLLESERSFH
jgi:16S rRNA (adenine1518-N6/adenine1519-N6)-dimethyltransferase